MLYQIYATMVKELKILLRDRGGVLTLFLMPIMFIMVMTSAGVGGVSGDAAPIHILVVNQDRGALAERALTALRSLEGMVLVEESGGTPLTREMADALIRDDSSYPVAVTFPPDFSERIAAQSQPLVSFVSDPALSKQVLSPIVGALQGVIERTVAQAQRPPDAAPPPAALGFEQVSPAGMTVATVPRPEQQNVPSYAIFGVFIIVSVVASSLLRERQEGTFRRLLAAPLSRPALLLGKLAPYYLVNLAQVALMFGVGVLAFGLELGGSPLGLVLVTLSVSAVASGLGLLIASVARTQEQIGGISNVLLITLSAIGGMFVPSFIMPDFMQKLSRLTPHSWALSGYHDVLVRGLGPGAVLGEVGVLLGFAAAFFGLALWRFRFE